MILGMSCFKVASGLEAKVKEAFLDRPHLVDHVPGFLGMETFTEEQDATAFYLVTRWTNAESFRAWEASPAYDELHRGITDGVALEPSFAKTFVLDRLSDLHIEASLRERVADAGELLAGVLAGSETLHFITGTREGVITACNRAATSALRVAEVDFVGSRIWEHLPESDAAVLRARIASGKRSPNQRLPVTFTTASQLPVVLSCWIDVQPASFTIIGEPALSPNAGYDEQLHGLNNELAVLVRENARKGKELAATKGTLQHTLDELNRTHWHLRKIAEVLPMCAECGKVKPGDGEWESVADYLRHNSLFLSHGCCPDCAGKLQAGLGVAADS